MNNEQQMILIEVEGLSNSEDKKIRNYFLTFCDRLAHEPGIQIIYRNIGTRRIKIDEPVESKEFLVKIIISSNHEDFLEDAKKLLPQTILANNLFCRDNGDKKFVVFFDRLYTYL